MPKQTSKVKPKTQAKAKTSAKSNPKSVILTSAMDKQWQKESDARTLKEAMLIQNDPARMKGAKEYVNKEMQALEKIKKLK